MGNRKTHNLGHNVWSQTHYIFAGLIDLTLSSVDELEIKNDWQQFKIEESNISFVWFFTAGVAYFLHFFFSSQYGVFYCYITNIFTFCFILYLSISISGDLELS